MKPVERPGDEELVSVHKVQDEASATLLRDFLAGQGVEASIVSAQIPWFGTIEEARKGYWGEIEVLEHDAARATKLIAEYLAARPVPDAPLSDDAEGGA